MGDPTPEQRDSLAWIIHGACGCDGECPPDHEDYAAAYAVLASPVLAELLATAKAEALRGAARDLPGLDAVRTHGDAARWLRERANQVQADQ